MGYAKYHEDDFGFVCERLYSNAIAYTKTKKEFIRILKCPYCQESFDAKNRLFAHIKSMHNIIKPILFINGSVVRDYAYLSDIKSVEVHMYGFDERILIDDIVCSLTADEYGILDITNPIAKEFAASGRCRVKIGDRTVNLEKYSLKNINQQQLSGYIDAWDDMLKIGSPLSMSIINRDELNQAEQFYLEGVFNYFVACQASGKDKNDRYLEANSILKNFVPINSLGLCIQKIVAFRLNWVHTLKQLCFQYETNDNFNKICDFFENKESENTSNSSKDIRNIYIEDELQAVFEAILSYQNKDYDSVKMYLTEHDENSVSDINLADKILLLKSRLKLIEGNKSEANYYKREIVCEEFK